MNGFKFGIFINQQDLIYSDDLLIIDILNQHKDIISEDDRNDYIMRLRKIFDDKTLVPCNDLYIDLNNNVVISGMYRSITGWRTIAKTFIDTKKGVWLTKEIMRDLVKSYPDLVYKTQIMYTNINTLTILETDTNFVLYDTEIYDKKILLSQIIYNRNFDNKLIDIKDLPVFIKKCINPEFETGLVFQLYTADYDLLTNIVEKTNKILSEHDQSLVECQIQIIHSNVNNTSRLQEDGERSKTDETFNMFTSAAFDLWDVNCFDKLKNF